ncbi:hypothetical protein OG453_37230 [Streptomyces sp. NBC_01381]|uniref:hypothetical protein n=1 Tax=Streptomyces sp. NBC_01381 TaxID=2903845 RepID=UPI0022581636|nr:hypothetical protein [Streptomyces sp. NBC_01381]MCX4672247.1 hypothetical protein [Streptomyces sp. NBC_01381]
MMIVSCGSVAARTRACPPAAATSNMPAIPGTGSPARLAENIAAAGPRLDAAELAELMAQNRTP